MRRQANESAIQASQLLGEAAKPLPDNSARIHSFYSDSDDTNFQHPNDSIITASIFNAVSNYSKNTFSIWDVLPERVFRLRYANAQYLKINELTGEAIGKRLECIFPAKIAKTLRRGFLDCIRHPREVEYTHDFFNGHMFSSRLFPHVVEGKVIRIACSGMDITDYVHEQNRLKAEGEQLKQQGQMLDTRLKFESIISCALREFMETGSDGFDGCLYGLSSGLGKVLGMDQALIFQKRSGGFLIHKAYWSLNGRPLYAPFDQMHHMQASGFGLAQLARLLAINDTHTTKAFSGAEELKAMQIRALLAVPISHDAQDYGLICLTQLNRPHVWTTAEISLVKTAAEIIMSAYQRLHLETGLRENMRVLAEYDESLQELLAQKETLAGVAQTFLRAGADHFAECTPHALRDIGRLLSADGVRTAVSSSGKATDLFTWREEGLPCRFGYNKSGFGAALQQAANSLSAPMVIDDMAETHPLTDLIQAGREEGLRSMLVVPIRRDDGLSGAIAFYKAIGIKYWSNADITSAESFLGIFLDAYRLQDGCTACDELDIRLQH